MSSNKEDDIYIDCSPTGESAENIATYNVPINSEYTKDAKKLDLMRTLLNLCLALIILIITYFTIPRLYKYGIIDPINREFPDVDKPDKEILKKTDEDANRAISELVFYDKNDRSSIPIKQRIARIYTADVYITLLFVFLLVRFIYSAKDGDYMSIYYAILLCGIYVMGTLIVTGVKKDETGLMRTQTAEGPVFTKFPQEEWEKQSDGTSKRIAHDFNAFSWLLTLDFAKFFGDVALYAGGVINYWNLNKKISIVKPLQTPVPFILLALLLIYFLVISFFTYGQIILQFFSLNMGNQISTNKDSWWAYWVINPIFITIIVLMFCLGFNIGTQDSAKK